MSNIIINFDVSKLGWIYQIAIVSKEFVSFY